MRFLFLINSFGAGGAERSLVEALPHLARRGIDATVVTLQREAVGFENEVRSAEYDVRSMAGKSRLAQIREFRSIVKDEKPDLVYTALFDADLVGRLACVGLPVPVMSNLVNTAYDPVRLEDPNIKRSRLMTAQLIDGYTARHFTDHFHAISEATKVSAVEQLGVEPDRITVIRRGRDVSRLGEPTAERRAEARRQLGVDDDAEVVLAVGRQEYQKGHRTLIEAAATIVVERPKMRLLIAGRKGNSSSELSQLVAELDLDRTVTLLGHRADVADILTAADLFVFPSLYEGLGGALIEAMALGLPIVASDLPAIREVVEEDENAALVPPGRSRPLAAAIVELLSDEERRDRFAARSRQIFDERFAGDQNIIDLIELMSSIAASSSNGSRPGKSPTHVD